MADTETGGLRERKRRATLDAIEHGAVELALEHGYEHVTVEMICEVATISQRTFFNYVGSKERAVLGVDPPLPSGKLRATYLAGMGGSPLEDLLDVIITMFQELGDDNASLLMKRRKIIRANPELGMKEFARLEEVETMLVQLVAQRLGSAGPSGSASSVDEDARMIVSLSIGIMHASVRDWVSAGVPDDPGTVLQGSVSVARRVIAATR